MEPLVGQYHLLMDIIILHEQRAKSYELVGQLHYWEVAIGSSQQLNM